LWDNLKILSERHNLAWAVMGDFNDVTNEEEKFGGNGICRRRAFEYTNCMDYYNLFYLGFLRSKCAFGCKSSIRRLLTKWICFLSFVFL